MTKISDQPFDPGPQGPDFTGATDPFALFAVWMAEAEKSEPVDPNAMALATVDAQGLPNLRMVLLKAYGPDGFVFYTNSESAKGTELAANLKAALLLYWKSLHRQVRIRGPVEMVSEAEADAYFATRSRESRVGAWASQQSRPLRKPRRPGRGGRALYGGACRRGTWRGRLIGRAIGWCRSRSSSGIAGRIGCTTGSCSGARTQAPLSPRRGSIRSGGKGLFCRYGADPE